MLVAAVRTALVVAAVLLCTLWPFLPGRHDPLAAPLSAAAQVVGKAGLLLVPVGAYGLSVERRRGSVDGRKRFALAAVVAGGIVWAATALAALALAGVCLAAVFVAAGVGVAWAARQRRVAASSSPATVLAASFVIAPVAVAALQSGLVGPASEWSRRRAIRAAAPFIADVEAYRVANGRYPPSLLSLWTDYDPGVVAIDRFRYEPSGESYNVAFEQLTADLAARVVVMYNPRGEQDLSAHDGDLLRLPPEDVRRQRGHFAVRPVPGHPGWMELWFD